MHSVKDPESKRKKQKKSRLSGLQNGNGGSGSSTPASSIMSGATAETGNDSTMMKLNDIAADMGNGKQVPRPFSFASGKA